MSTRRLRPLCRSKHGAGPYPPTYSWWLQLWLLRDMACIYIYTDVCIYYILYVYMYIHIYICKSIYIYIRVCISMYTYIYIYMCVCPYMSWLSDMQAIAHMTVTCSLLSREGSKRKPPELCINEGLRVSMPPWALEFCKLAKLRHKDPTFQP